ncbi:hypothetical protein PSDVSF_04440 [Pseudodesulfovibrio sediminis]|uniref:Uncharacterized protein n=1 Tax=Pseudodesulfovibrio sediminis TaxID=2810563 RepID=A0ABN6EMB8_9BACT|nr:hypothetical protein PSDVSF_04440 [Pseudodesulfovibrio sediminis]
MYVVYCRLHAHLRTAGASKKAKAKKEKEAKAILVRVHANLFIIKGVVSQGKTAFSRFWRAR